VPLPNENYDKLILRNSYRYWNFSPNDVLGNWKYQYGVKKKAATRGMYSNWKLIDHIQSFLLDGAET
jgi:hypothetical protein